MENRLTRLQDDLETSQLAGGSDIAQSVVPAGGPPQAGLPGPPAALPPGLPPPPGLPLPGMPMPGPGLMVNGEAAAYLHVRYLFTELNCEYRVSLPCESGSQN